MGPETREMVYQFPSPKVPGPTHFPFPLSPAHVMASDADTPPHIVP